MFRRWKLTAQKARYAQFDGWLSDVNFFYVAFSLWHDQQLLVLVEKMLTFTVMGVLA